MSSPEEILTFKISNFNRAAATIGGYLSVFGLVSYLLKEKFYLGEALISTIAGVIFSPHATNLVRPLEYAQGNEITLESITLYFSRLVLGVQLVIAGIQLPPKYLKTEWKSLAMLLGPGMCAMWISTGLIVWALVPDIPFLYALAVGSCVTPTDPVLSNSIVKGKFADKNIPKGLQNLIIGESGANDGLGFPFLFLALYLFRYTYSGGLGQTGGASKAMGYWFGITWGYTIIMGTLYGALVGYVFKVALQWAERRKYVDRESFLVFCIAIGLFIVGTLGMIGGDDVLASFIAGNVFNWDDWFRDETKDDSLQPTIDMLLNVAIFAWYGAVCPWYSFAHNDQIPVYRLIFLGILVLLFRRLPFVIAVRKTLNHVEDWRQTLFLGYFGPIGVSAIFYLYTSREYLRTIKYHSHERRDAARLEEIFDVVVWFIVMCSIIAHGLSVPLGKLWFYLPRTISRAVSEKSTDHPNGDSAAPFRIREATYTEESALEDGIGHDSLPRHQTAPSALGNPPARRRLFKIGGRIIKDTKQDLNGVSRHPEGTTTPKRDGEFDKKDVQISLPASEQSPWQSASADKEISVGAGASAKADETMLSPQAPETPLIPGTPARSIRFGDE